ncbi:MAG: class I SAM-dependent methyltransferase, partial [Cyanobacteria bacterium J06598_3]
MSQTSTNQTSTNQPSTNQTSTSPTPSYTQTYFESSEIWAKTIAPYQQQVLNDIVAIMPADVSTVLDVGCGNGLLTNALPEHLQVTGFDRSYEALSQVKTTTVQGDITQLPFADEAFDLVMNNDVLEHLSPNIRQQALSEMARVAKKAVILTVPFLEDLNQNSTRCGACDRFYHVNHHQAVFDLDDTRQLLEPFGWTCIRQVLSGAQWEQEQPGHVAYKRLHGLEWAHADAPMCPHCGSKTQAPLQPKHKREEQLHRLQRARAQEAVTSPLVSDWCDRRTECMSLYSKHSVASVAIEASAIGAEASAVGAKASAVGAGASSTPTPTKPTFLTATGDPVELPTTTIRRNALNFSQAQHYKTSHLPHLSNRPYFLSEGTTDSTGIQLEAGQPLIFGFYTEPSNPTELAFEGIADPGTKISISYYKDLESYQLVVETDASEILAPAGEMSQRTVSLEGVGLCAYGYLFQIIPTDGALKLSKIELTNADSATLADSNIPSSLKTQTAAHSYQAYDNTDGKA